MKKRLLILLSARRKTSCGCGSAQLGKARDLALKTMRGLSHCYIGPPVIPYSDPTAGAARYRVVGEEADTERLALLSQGLELSLDVRLPTHQGPVVRKGDC